MVGGELFVPKIPSMRMLNLAKALAPKAKIKIIGIRPGEKLHESLIAKVEALNTYDIGDRYMIAPVTMERWNMKNIKYKYKKVAIDFEYNSLNNPKYISNDLLRKMLNSNDIHY